MASKKIKKGVTGKAITVASEPLVSPVVEVDPDATLGTLESPTFPPVIEPLDVDLIPVEQPSIVSHPTVGVRIHQERDEAYIVQAGDLLLHPELSQQGVQLHDTVAYGSKWVLKSIVKGGEEQQVSWPVSISSQRY